MKEFLIIAASTVLVYFLLLPIVGWYQKSKKEMEDADRD